MNPSRGPRYKQIPLWRDANCFLVEVEQAVRAFPRYHKYTLGSVVVVGAALAATNWNAGGSAVTRLKPLLDGFW